MLFGYAIVTNGQNRELLLTLKANGCQQIFTDQFNHLGNPGAGFKKALSRLNKNDILVITTIKHLGKSVDSVIKNLAAIKSKKANLQILDKNFLFSLNNSRDVSLLEILIDCQQDIYQSQTIARQQTTARRGKRPGRRTGINPRTKKKIQDLIDENYTVKVICQRTGISASTFYKYFSKAGGERSSTN